MPSETLTRARAYEAQHGVEIPASERPVYHLTPYVGWMNDPNGFSFYKGQYHQFYQYNPYKTQWGPMHWGHAVSTDLLHWDYLPCALAPDMPYDDGGKEGGGCFSGSAAELPDGRQLLLYTSVIQEEQPDGKKRDIQTQSIAVGDGLNYEKPACNPVLTEKDLPAGFSRFDFRDPKLWREPDGSYSAVIVSRTEDDSGAVLLYHSPDGFDWEFVTVLDRCNNEYGKMWECPDFFELDGKQVILLSPQEMQARGEFHNGFNALCLLGSYDAAAHTFARESVHLIDHGIDFYATQTTLAPDGRRIMTAWMQSWADVEDKPTDCKWFGQTICPRELHLKEGRLTQTPLRELDAVHGACVRHENVPIQLETALDGIGGRVADLTLTIAPEEEMYRSFTLKLAADEEYFTALTYDAFSSQLTLDRTRSGSRADVVHTRSCKVRRQEGLLKLRVLLDRNSIEVFVNDGEQTMTAVIYTPQTADGITFAADGKVRLTVEQYALNL